MDKPRIMKVSEHVDVAVSFGWTYQQIDPDPRKDAQSVVVCILRPLGDGPKETFYGVAVHNPRNCYDMHQGQKIALARALEQLTGDDSKTCRHMARRWFWEQDQAGKVPASTPIAVEA